MGSSGSLHQGPAVAHVSTCSFTSPRRSNSECASISFFFVFLKKNNRKNKCLHSNPRPYANTLNSTIHLGNQKSYLFYAKWLSVFCPEWLPSSTFTHFALAITTHLKIPGPESLSYSFPLAVFSSVCPRIAGPPPSSTACTHSKHCFYRGPTGICVLSS